jgi:hypothetical protein
MIMINNNIVLNNPHVPGGYYFAQVLSIEAEPVSDFIFPKLLIRLQLHPAYGLPQENVFASVLYPTGKSFFHYKNFYNTFMLGNYTDELNKAVGQWGSVQIAHSTLVDEEYSAVRFVYQPIPIRMESWRLNKEEKNGGTEGGGPDKSIGAH